MSRSNENPSLLTQILRFLRCKHRSTQVGPLPPAYTHPAYTPPDAPPPAYTTISSCFTRRVVTPPPTPQLPPPISGVVRQLPPPPFGSYPPIPFNIRQYNIQVDEYMRMRRMRRMYLTPTRVGVNYEGDRSPPFKRQRTL